jgi:hypothetical protein
MNRKLIILTITMIAAGLLLIPRISQASTAKASNIESQDTSYLPLVFNEATSAQSIQGQITDGYSNPISGVVVTAGN